MTQHPFVTRIRLVAALFALCAMSLPCAHAQAPQFPGMGGIGGIGGIVDCKMLQEMMAKSGMPPQMQQMLSMMGCAPGAAVTPRPAIPPAATAPVTQHNARCDMYNDLSHPMPQIWLGPMPVLNARDLEGCRFAPLTQQWVDGLRYFGEGRLAQSEAAFQAVAAQTSDAALRLRALAELAKTQLAAKRTSEARATLELALPLTTGRSAVNSDARDRAVLRAELLTLMGVALEQSNDLPGAIARYREANALTPTHAEMARLGMSDPASEIATPYLAAALLRAGQSAEARTLLQHLMQEREQTANLADSGKVMDDLFGNLPIPLPLPIGMPKVSERFEAMSIYGGDMSQSPFACAALARLDNQAQATGRALEGVEQCRGRALARTLANSAFHRPEPSALAFPSAQEMQAEIRAGTHEQRQAERVRAAQDAARNPNPRARAASRPATIDDMRRMAAERNATLVVYAIDYEPGVLPLRMPDRETGIIAWVVSPDGRVSTRQRGLEGLFPGGTLSLSAAALRLRESMGVPGRGAVRAALAALRPAASGSSTDLKRFYQLLIEPIRDLLPTHEGARLIIVPERALFLIPFAALENASGEPLIAQHALSVTPSLQTLALATLRKPAARGADLSSYVVVGNPLMPAYTPKPGGRAMDIPPLPGAEEEAKAIAAILKTTALTGAAATKNAVMKQIANARYVHLATHGFLDRLTDVAQSGVNPHVREIALFDETAEGGIKTPGMLALAPAGGDSGMLTADEIAQSSTTAELVVMSACDSGRGAINDDGVIGLSRAWMAAGAPSVMVTLWTIPDDATKDLMVTFYQQLAAGTRKAEALRLAMLAARAKYPDPFNWAAFMLIGEPD